MTVWEKKTNVKIVLFYIELHFRYSLLFYLPSVSLISTTFITALNGNNLTCLYNFVLPCLDPNEPPFSFGLFKLLNAFVLFLQTCRICIYVTS